MLKFLIDSDSILLDSKSGNSLTAVAGIISYIS